MEVCLSCCQLFYLSNLKTMPHLHVGELELFDNAFLHATQTILYKLCLIHASCTRETNSASDRTQLHVASKAMLIATS